MDLGTCNNFEQSAQRATNIRATKLNAQREYNKHSVNIR